MFYQGREEEDLGTRLRSNYCSNSFDVGARYPEAQLWSVQNEAAIPDAASSPPNTSAYTR